MEKNKIRWLDRDIVIGPYLTLTLTQEETIAAYKHLAPKEFNPETSIKYSAGVTYSFYRDDKLAIIVALDNWAKRDLPSIIGLIIHEASHVIDIFMETIGETTPSSEFKAYSIQNVSQILIEEFLERVQIRNMRAVSLKK
jgi:hypothetical protein